MGPVRARSMVRRIPAIAGLGLVLAGCSAAPDGSSRPALRALADSPLLPVELAGMTRADVEFRLGPPDFARQDSPALFLQYRLGPCVIDLFLYADARSGEHQVVHYELRDHGHAGMPGPCGGQRRAGHERGAGRGLPAIESH